VITINRTYTWSIVTQILRKVNEVMVATIKRSKWWLQLNH